MFVSVMLLLVGLWMIVAAVRIRRRLTLCRSWPSVEGLMLESRVDSSKEDPEFVIRYRYVVDGREYVGHRLSLDGHELNTTVMERLIAPYPVGRAVRIHHDPACPDMAVLKTDLQATWTHQLSTGLIFCLIAAALFLKNWGSAA